MKLVSTASALRACLAQLPRDHLRHTVYFKKTNRACFLIADEFNFQVIRTVEATGTEGFFGCDPEQLRNFLKARQGLVTLTLEGGMLCVAHGGDRAALTTTHSINELPLPEPLTTPIIDTTTFKNAVERVALAASTNDGHGIHQAIRLECGEAVRMVATDHYQLAIEDMSLNTGLQCVTHLKANLLRCAVAKLNPKERLRIFLHDDTFILEQPNHTLTLPTMDGTFQRYERVIPRTFERTVSLNGPTFLEDVRLATKNSNEKNHAIFLACDHEKCWLTTRDKNAKRQPPAAHLLAFNGILLGKVLERFSDELQLHVSGVKRPCLITESNSSFRVLVTTLDINTA